MRIAGSQRRGDNSAMLPKSLCIVDDDREYTEYLGQYLRQQGVAVTTFLDSDDFLTSDGAFDFDFYLVDLMLPGVDGLDLIRLLRRRSDAGIVVVSSRLGAEVLDTVLTAGADMYLAKPLRFEQIALAIKAVARRARIGARPPPAWRLDHEASVVTTPQGVVVRLSETDLAVLSCFVDTDGATVTRASICERLGREQTADSDNWLHATIYRLRRRLEQATEELVPLQSQPRVGYVFRARLTAA